jgi:hypothetical protein
MASVRQLPSGMVARYLDRPLGDVGVEKIRTHALDVLYAELAARGGRCRHRPCPRTSCPRGRRRCPSYKRGGHPPCTAHDGACADWVPCDTSPCEHGGPLDVATVARVHGVVHSMLEQARKWGWGKRSVADDANPGEVVEEEPDIPEEQDVIRLLADLDDVDPDLAGR